MTKPNKTRQHVCVPLDVWEELCKRAGRAMLSRGDSVTPSQIMVQLLREALQLDKR